MRLWLLIIRTLLIARFVFQSQGSRVEQLVIAELLNDYIVSDPTFLQGWNLTSPLRYFLFAMDLIEYYFLWYFSNNEFLKQKK